MRKIIFPIITLLICLASCEFRRIEEVRVEIQPEISVPFAQFIYTKHNLFQYLPDLPPQFQLNDIEFNEYLNIDGADLSDISFNEILIFSENKFPFALSFEIQFINITDSSAISEIIPIATTSAANTNESYTNTNPIKVEDDLLEDIRSSTGIRVTIKIDTLSDVIIASLTEEQTARLNIGITTSVAYNDTIQISAQQ